MDGASPWFQAVYYIVTGVWPLVGIDTFQAVTGPKTDNLPTGGEGDHWLVMTVAVLVLVVGPALLIAAVRRRILARGWRTWCRLCCRSDMHQRV